MDQEQNTGSYEPESQQRVSRRPKNQPFEELRTLFLSGLPNDVKEREIHNLMRFFPGYEGCVLHLNENVGRPVCFTSFTDRNSALRALRVLQDLRFDPNVPQTLRIEFAKTNSKTRRLPQEFYAEKRRRSALAAAASSFFGPTPYGTYNSPGYGVDPNMLVPWFQNLNMRGNSGNLPTYPGELPFAPLTPPNPFGTPPQMQPSKVPPCSTLFVANLHPDVQERDLIRLFKIIQGFRRLRLNLKDGVPICFVEFESVQSSTHALTTFQGFPIGPSSIRVEYARTRMGETKRTRSDDGEQGKNQDNDTSPSQHNDDNNDEGSDQLDDSLGTKRHYSQEQ